VSTYTSIHDVVSISAQKHIIEGAGGDPRFIFTFVIKTDEGKTELRLFSHKNLVIDFKETVVEE